LLLLVGLALATNVRAQQPDKTLNQGPTQKAGPNNSVLDVNNSAAWVTRRGFFDWNLGYTPGNKNGAFPARTATGTIFAQGLMWGGIVRDGLNNQLDSVRVNGSTYETGLAPGGLNPDGTPEDQDATYSNGNLKYRVYRVHRNWVNESVLRNSAGYDNAKPPGEVTQSEIAEIRDRYSADWNQWPAQMGAPYEECNGQPGYQPANPDSVAAGVECGSGNLNGDIPGRPGADQTIWLVTNDIGSASNTDASRESYSSPAIGVEAQYTIWGYDRPPGAALGNINFIETKLIYTGRPNSSPNATIDSMFTSWWVDPDVGSSGDDFAGVDTSRSMGYAYNASATDGAFSSRTGGQPPPAVGFDFLKGPKGLGLSSYVFFAAGSDITDPGLGEGYAGTLQWYNLMRGFKPRPDYPQADPFVNPITGEESKVTLPGDPVSGSGWIDGSTLPPGDRRIVNTAGPFSMTKGDTVSVVVGSMSAIGTSNITSISRLRFFDSAAQFAFDENFNIPGPPSSPNVQAADLDGEIVLNWGTDDQSQQQIESYSASPGFEFEAYRVYQLPSATASLEQGERIETFDKQNNIRTLVNNVFEQESGFVVEKPVQALRNEGIQRYLSITEDEIRDRPIANGVDYHFAVTSVGYLNQDADVPSRILESSPARITVRPEPPEPGTVDSTVAETDQLVPVTKSQGTGTAEVTARVVDPSQTAEANYAITINANQTWNLSQDGNTVLANQDFGVQPDRNVINGLKVDVSNVTFQTPTTFASAEHTEQTDDGLASFFDHSVFFANGYYTPFTGQPPPTVEEAQQDLELRFTGNGSVDQPTTEGGQLASYYETDALRADPAGKASNVIRAPFELWETETNTQINFALIGVNIDGNSPWGTGAPPDDGYYRIQGRDYIIPIHTEYDEQQVRNNGTNPAAPEASWAWFFNGGEWETGDVFRVEYPNPVTAGVDTWTFSTDSTETGNEEVAKATVEDIGVFPNPYRGFNQLENSRFNKFVRFTHLPNPKQFGPSTIRIFTLSGNPVRVLKHNEETAAPTPQFRDWDLENQSGIPVASGVYLVHINTPVGDKTLKVAIVQEEEILERY